MAYDLIRGFARAILLVPNVSGVFASFFLYSLFALFVFCFVFFLLSRLWYFFGSSFGTSTFFFTSFPLKEASVMRMHLGV